MEVRFVVWKKEIYYLNLGFVKSVPTRLHESHSFCSKHLNHAFTAYSFFFLFFIYIFVLFFIFLNIFTAVIFCLSTCYSVVYVG
jgi:hypothetical protein